MGTELRIGEPLFEQLEPRTLMSALPVKLPSAPIRPPAEEIREPAAPVFQSSVVGALATTEPLVVSTIPSNGDVNPYGTVFVPHGFKHGGPLHEGDLLVSNFNDAANLQGTGTTIVRIDRDGELSTFFQGTRPLGLTTALGILKHGFIIVGNMPTTDGTSATVVPGSLLVINRFGQQVAEFADPDFINGPWDLAIHETGHHAQLFVSNVLSGTITRLELRECKDTVKVISAVQIGSGFAHRFDPSALVLGPTGLVFDHKTHKLFVASTADNAIFVIPRADKTNKDNGTGSLFFGDQTRLHGPLGMVQAPNGDLIFANGDAVNPDPAQPSEIVEITQSGQFVSQFSIDSNPDAPFGIAITVDSGRVRFAAVNDNQNIVNIWNLGHTVKPGHKH